MTEKQFYQADVAESDSDSLWTGPVVYGSLGEAEFLTMLTLQQDWGDSYMPPEFLDAFGRTQDEDGNDIASENDDPVYPGDDAWEAAGYWNDLDVTTGMLTLPPIEALAQLGKIKLDLTEQAIENVMADKIELHLTVRQKAIAA
jgi:hypothetical protein